MRAALAWMFLFAAAASGAVAETSDTIVAKGAPDLVLIWKTNDEVNALAAAGKRGDDLYYAVLAEGVRVMRTKRQTNAKTTTLRLVYFHSASDPNYKIETVSGIDTLGTLKAAEADLAHLGAKWQEQLAKGAIPPGLHVDVSRAWIART